MPTRTDALTALLAAQSKPKIVLSGTEGTDRPSSAGMVGTVGTAFSRTRDRVEAAEASKPAPVKPTPQNANTAMWAQYEENWRKRLGSYVKL